MKYLVHLVVGATTLQLFGIYNNWQKVSVIFFFGTVTGMNAYLTA